MLVPHLVTILLGATSIVSSTAIERPIERFDRREAELVESHLVRRFDVAHLNFLERRKGGGGGSSGGGGGKSSGGGSSLGSGSGSSGSGSGSGSGSSGSSSRSSGAGGGSTNRGNAGSTSPATPQFGGGRYYGGGATTPYRAGGLSPVGRIAPYALIGAGLLIFPGIWLYGAYAYNFDHPYNFHNRTNTTAQNANAANESLPVTCLCDQYSACGCDDNNNTTYLDAIIGDGNPANFNTSLVNVATVNGTKTVVLNGTLPNGTDTSSSSSGTRGYQTALEACGLWVLGAIVMATVYIL